MISHREHDISSATICSEIAVGCDREPLRFIGFCADRLVTALRASPGDKVLDVVCGTGAVTLAAAQAVTSAGRVTAIDSCEAMLARLDAKLAQFGVTNVDVHVMDGARLDFRRDYYHHVVCSLALFGLSEPAAALTEWRRVLRPGGSVTVTSFGPGAFEPGLTILRTQLRAAGVDESALVLPWEPWVDSEQLAALLRNAGLVDVSVEPLQLGYHLKDAEQWWEVVQFSGLRRLLAGLSAADATRIEAAHLAEIARLVTADGLPMNVNIHLARARKPAA